MRDRGRTHAAHNTSKAGYTIERVRVGREIYRGETRERENEKEQERD